MSTTAEPAPPAATASTEGIGAKLKQFVVAALFTLVLFIPKLIGIRRNPHSWLLFRIVLGLSGAALVLLPLRHGNAWLVSLVGLTMFLLAVLLPPLQPRISVDDKARELGVLVVVNGGEYQSANGIPTPARLFVGADRISVLDNSFQEILAISTDEIRNVAVVRLDSDWYLRLECAGSTAEFVYRGFFAEHLARVAESTLRSILRSPLLVLQPAPSKSQSRAAGA